MANDKPTDWKNYEDFAAGIDANRLPPARDLAGKTFELSLGDSPLTLDFKSETHLQWHEPKTRTSGVDAYDAVQVAPSTYFLDMAFEARPREALTVIVNTSTHRSMAVRQRVRERKVEGEPLVQQEFSSGTLGAVTALGGLAPGPTRDLIGLRAFYRYSPRHLYEHVYLSSERYCWQCLVGEQRGHGDVDLATTWKFDEGQYVFTFREFIIPVASVFFYNFADLRSTGKFLGVSGDGRVENRKAGAVIRKSTVTTYEPGTEPV